MPPLKPIAKRHRTPRPNEANTRPSGPVNPFVIEHNDTGWVRIADAWKRFEQENAHRRPEAVTLNNAALNSFLNHSGLHENSYVVHMTRARCKVWKQWLIEAPPKVGGRKAGPATINARMAKLAQFFRYCVANDMLERNPMEGLALNARLVKASRVKKVGFTDTQLATIYTTMTPYRDDSRVEFVELFWCVLLLMVTGARSQEIMHLLKSDVRKAEGVTLVNIEPRPERLLKNRESQRVVPVHSWLLKQGFLEWMKGHAPQDPRLFPTLCDRGDHLFSLFFSKRILKGWKTPSLSLHSLRHTLTQKLARARTFSALQNRLLGHAIGVSVEDRVYLGSLEFSVQELSEAIEKVSFPSLEGGATMRTITLSVLLLLGSAGLVFACNGDTPAGTFHPNYGQLPPQTIVVLPAGSINGNGSTK